MDGKKRVIRRKPRKNCLVKLSGDCVELSQEMLAWLRTLSSKYYLVLLVGGGTQINEEWGRRGWKTNKPHGPLGREHETFEERQVARDVLERNQAAVQDLLAAKRIPATVIIPVLDIASVLCHVNGDQFVRTAYIGYDKLYVVTTPDRHAKKASEFKDLTKVEVVAFS